MGPQKTAQHAALTPDSLCPIFIGVRLGGRPQALSKPAVSGIKKYVGYWHHEVWCLGAVCSWLIGGAFLHALPFLAARWQRTAVSNLKVAVGTLLLGA